MQGGHALPGAGITSGEHGRFPEGAGDLPALWAALTGVPSGAGRQRAGVHAPLCSKIPPRLQA